MEIQKVISDNIVRLRGDTPRKELAKRANVTYQTIYDIEEGNKNPSIEVIVKIADALNVDPSKLLENKPEAKIIEMPVSKVLKKMASVPDDIYDLAEEFSDDPGVWDFVRSRFKIAREKREKEKARDNQKKG
jgi:transcriptional regulator with XRE-family HTH domain